MHEAKTKMKTMKKLFEVWYRQVYLKECKKKIESNLGNWRSTSIINFSIITISPLLYTTVYRPLVQLHVTWFDHHFSFLI